MLKYELLKATSVWCWMFWLTKTSL